MIKTGTVPHQVFWEEPKFHDNVDSINQLKVVSTHENGVKFSKGRHTIIVTARDRATNTANCTFDIELESKLNVNCRTLRSTTLYHKGGDFTLRSSK